MSAIDSDSGSIPSTSSADATALGRPDPDVCSERPGIVQAVTSFLLNHGLDIVEHHQAGGSRLAILQIAFGSTDDPTETPHLRE